METFLDEFFHLATDPAHLLLEFCFVLLDVLVIQAVASRIKKHFHKDIADEHTKIEREHGLEHPIARTIREQVERERHDEWERQQAASGPYDHKRSGI